jgi:hypothetical protein
MTLSDDQIADFKEFFDLFDSYSDGMFFCGIYVRFLLDFVAVWIVVFVVLPSFFHDITNSLFLFSKAILMLFHEAF